MKRIAVLIVLTVLARPCGAEPLQARCDSAKLRTFFNQADALLAALGVEEAKRDEAQNGLVTKYSPVIEEKEVSGMKKWILKRTPNVTEREGLCPKGGTVWRFAREGLGLDEAAWNAQSLKIQVNILALTNEWYKTLDRKMAEVKKAAEAVYKAAGSEGLGAVKSESFSGDMAAVPGESGVAETVAVGGPRNFEKETAYTGLPSLDGLEGDAKKRKIVAYYDRKFKLLKSLVEEVKYLKKEEATDVTVERKPGQLVKTFYSKVEELQGELKADKVKAAINPTGVTLNPTEFTLGTGLAEISLATDRKAAREKLAECTGWIDGADHGKALCKIDLALRNQVCMHADNVEAILDLIAKTVEEAADAAKTVNGQETAVNTLINANLNLDGLKLDLTKTFKGKAVEDGMREMGAGWARSQAGLEAAGQWEAAKTEARDRMKTERMADGKYKYFDKEHPETAKIYDSLEALEADTRGRAELVEGVAESLLKSKTRLEPMLQAVGVAVGKDGKKYDSQDYDAKKALGPCNGETEEEYRKRLENECRGDAGDCAAKFDAAEKTYHEKVDAALLVYESGEGTQARQKEYQKKVDAAKAEMTQATKDCGGDRQKHAAKVAACASIAANRAAAAFNKEVDTAVQEIKVNWLANTALAKSFLAADADKEWLAQLAEDANGALLKPENKGHTNLHQYFTVNWETAGEVKTKNSNRCRGYLEAGAPTDARAAAEGEQEKSFETCMGEILADWAPTVTRARGKTPEELRREAELYQR